ncbi:tannase/feruloyl esterase family alpha/beta hydrolase [Plantactinospora sp. KLBMP9567]|uniref:tannase/feruloyl esterase family alpha/beta hydrolase n=1 Tax=Plantactinospora sp. KLBMP9567 TaxID=3085900 RepID=UPI0029811BD6|nr:tannase/feruloyl esterase family alpha/beta hydrolase [Plantactinospora sp. KLBMP9567]MDW5330289.1 tannase/feruloyl esterase family alpha/beta hydrolase [Plantactinospora sp. KLBMP9567]
MRNRRSLLTGLAALTGAVLVLWIGSSVSAAGSNRPVRSCASLASTNLPHTTMLSATAVTATASVPAHCAVQLVVTNPPAGDQIRVGVWLPTENWNGRFQGTGGGGFSGGSPTSTPAAALRDGYAAAATDAGHTGGSGSFALNSDGTLNWQLIADFGYLGIHEMTVAGKALVERFYRPASFHSYFNGCSTGGRQGLMEAQRYPSDYDGIAAASPAVNWTKFHPAQFWGQLQMMLSGNVIPQCKLAAATQAAITACDGRDGVTDGIVGDWQGCRFDARRLIGTETDCGTVTAADADLINKIWEGPRDADGGFLWYGLERDASLGALNNTSGGNQLPFGVGLDWFRYFLLQNPGWDWRTMTYDRYLLLFQQSVLQYQAVIATDDPDLSAFRDAGGKVVFWHGTADPLIFFRGTVDYYQRLEAAMGGAKQTQKFARFFVAPGVGHCGGGQGAAPTDLLNSVVRWVEQGKAPSSLVGRRIDGGGDVLLTRPVCQYPLVARYKGHGTTTEAKNFTCASGYHK